MKKFLAILIIIVLVIVVVCIYKYNIYKVGLRETEKLNSEYEQFTQGEILGTSLITIINKTIDMNKQNNIKLDENNFYIENETNSIKIEIKFLESDTIYPMERISELGTEKFIKNYATTSFKCTMKKYHEKSDNIKYLLFEQI